MPTNNTAGTAAGLKDIQSSDPRDHAVQIKDALKELSDHARRDVEKIDDPKARVLFETTAEVLDGLHKAYEDYETQAEPAWK